jgi:drug/metabolite transporter (DMT)-like permease
MISRLRKIKNGILLSLLATFCFSLGNVFTKMISDSVPFSQIAFARSFIGLIIVASYMAWNGYTFSVKKKRILILRGMLGAVALLCSFYAISKIKLAEVSILFQLSPFFVAVFARFILKERLPRFFYILLFFSLAGCLLVMKPSFSNIGSLPALMSIVASVLAALAYVCVRSMSKEYRSHMIVLYFCLTAAIVPMPWIPFFIVPSYYQLFILLMIGVVTTFAQFFLTKAYGLEKAGVVSMVGYVGVLLNIFWGVVIWREYLDTASIIGGVLILASCVILSWSVYKKKEDMAPVLPGD